MMRKSAITRTLIILALALQTPLSALGWRANQLAMTPSALAMAGAGIAWAPNRMLIEVSPAHIWGVTSESIGYGNLKMFGDLSGNVLSWQGGWRGRPTQLQLRTMVEDGIELRGEIPTAEPQGLITAREISATLTRGWQMAGGELGLSMTVAYQRMYIYDSRATSIAAGWRKDLGEWISVGASLSQLGIGEAFNADKIEALPFNSGVGLLINLPANFGGIGVDLKYYGDVGLLPIVAWQLKRDGWHLQTGILRNDAEYRLAIGFGIEHNSWHVGYAYSYQNSSLGQPRMLQASRSF